MEYCHFCGLQLPDGTAFCQGCGYSQVTASQETSHASSETSPAVSAASTRPVPGSSGSDSPEDERLALSSDSEQKQQQVEPLPPPLLHLGQSSSAPTLAGAPQANSVPTIPGATSSPPDPAAPGAPTLPARPAMPGQLSHTGSGSAGGTSSHSFASSKAASQHPAALRVGQGFAPGKITTGMALKIVAGLLAGSLLIIASLKLVPLFGSSNTGKAPVSNSPVEAPGSTGLENPLGGVDWAKVIKDPDCSRPPGPQPGIEIDEQRFGDVTADNKAEAFIAFSCIPGTSRWPSYLEVFDGASDPAHPRLLDILLSKTDGVDERGLRIGKNAGLSQSITITGKTVTVRSQGYAPADANCCATQQVTDVFTWDGQGFAHEARSVVSVS